MEGCVFEVGLDLRVERCGFTAGFAKVLRILVLALKLWGFMSIPHNNISSGSLIELMEPAGFLNDIIPKRRVTGYESQHGYMSNSCIS